jgi:hypothetical protein
MRAMYISIQADPCSTHCAAYAFDAWLDRLIAQNGHGGPTFAYQRRRP